MRVYKDKKIIITGHTGFKGSWLALWLNYLGAEVIGISDELLDEPSNFVSSGIGNLVKTYKTDIRDTKKIRDIILDEEPDFIFHLAAQALVKESYVNPVETMSINAIGTANVLNALRELNNKVVAIFITSDKVYDNLEWSWGYRENDLIGGKDPYSASKGMAEIAIKSFFNSFLSTKSNLTIGITRAGNVIGGGDWAKDRIVPDCMKSWSKGNFVEIRNPNSTIPWQHVLEPISGYLCLANKLFESSNLNGEAFNFGPPANNNYSVSSLIDEMSNFWGNIGWLNRSNENHAHEANLLKLNCDKALAELSWSPALDFKTTVEYTVNWYREYYTSKKSMLTFSLNQIKSYTQAAKDLNIPWADE